MAENGKNMPEGGGENPQDYSGFVKEEIKKRPVNRRRLMRRLFLTSFLAVVFGVVACAAFLLLQPVISDMLYPETPPQKVSFPEETQAEEMSPQDMLASDADGEPNSQGSDAVGELGISAMEAASSLATVQAPEGAYDRNAEEGQQDPDPESARDGSGESIREEEPPGVEEHPEESGEDKEASGKLFNALLREENAAEYAAIYSSLRTVVRRVYASLTGVSAVGTADDWLQDPYEAADPLSGQIPGQLSGQTPGMIIADNGEELLILTRYSPLRRAERLRVTFAGGRYAEGSLKAADRASDLCVIAVDKDTLSRDTLDTVKVCGLGSSNAADLLGMPVIALGAPAGSMDSVIYGSVTGATVPLDIMDAHYRHITTDIYGSANASGVLVNLSGRIIGIIDMRLNSADMPYALSAVGITELKGLIEKLSNGETKACLGIHAVDVPASFVREEGLPAGAYVVRTEMGSPAMESGIMSGDIITEIRLPDGNVTSVGSCADYVGALLLCEPGDEIDITFRRAGASGYAELTVRAGVSAGDELFE